MSFDPAVTTYFPGSTVTGTTSVSFVTADLPSVLVDPTNNIDDIREVIYSILDKFSTVYDSLPATDGGAAINAKDLNLTITKSSAIASDDSNGTRIRVNFAVSFLTVPGDVNVVDAP